MPLTPIPARLGHVVVRCLVASDHQSYIALERDAEVRQYVNGPSTKTDDEFLHGLRTYEPTTSLLVIADASTNEFLGRCGLLPVQGTNEVEVFLLLAKSSQRKGVGQVVLQFLLALARSQGNEPVGVVHPGNLPSRALMEKAGMLCVGTVSSTDYQNGHLRYVPAIG